MPVTRFTNDPLSRRSEGEKYRIRRKEFSNHPPKQTDDASQERRFAFTPMFRNGFSINQCLSSDAPFCSWRSFLARPTSHSSLLSQDGLGKYNDRITLCAAWEMRLYLVQLRNKDCRFLVELALILLGLLQRLLFDQL